MKGKNRPQKFGFPFGIEIFLSYFDVILTSATR
jgi:hypothetical protein